MKNHEQDRVDDGDRPGGPAEGRTLIARLEQLRAQAGRPTVEAIARHSGRSMGAVSNTFSGTAVPSDDTANRIVTALGGTFDEEWRALLTAARAERDLKNREKNATPAESAPAPPSRPTGNGRNRRTVLVVGVAVLALVAAAAIAFLPGLGRDEAQRSTRGDVQPLVVTRAGPLGLIVRSSGMRDGEQIGSAAEGQTLWAECRAVTDFDPRPDTGQGSNWYRVRWPSPEPGKDFLSSTPQDEYSGWVYGAFAAPATPGGASVPRC